MPRILIISRDDDTMPRGVIREWEGPVPEGWVQIGYIDESGKRYVNWELPTLVE